MLYRPRRNRKSLAIRNLVQETRITPSQLISCHFVIEGKGVREELKSLPGVFALSVDELVREAKSLLENMMKLQLSSNQKDFHVISMSFIQRYWIVFVPRKLVIMRWRF